MLHINNMGFPSPPLVYWKPLSFCNEWVLCWSLLSPRQYLLSRAKYHLAPETPPNGECWWSQGFFGIGTQVSIKRPCVKYRINKTGYYEANLTNKDIVNK